MIDGYYEVSEVAQEWGVTPRSVQQMCNKGRIPGAIKIGRTWRVPVGVPKPKDGRVKAGDYKDARQRAKGEIPQSAKENMKFIENMSRDIRSSLHTILGYADIMQRHMDDREKLSEGIAKIQTSGKYINNLISNVLEYERLNSGMVTLQEEVVNTEKLVSEVIKPMQEEIEKKSLKVSVSQDVRHEFIYADKERYVQILQNIISNAVKFTEKGGQISIRLVERESRIPDRCLYEYRIADTGIGIPEHVKEHIFDSFLKTHMENYNTEGCGLGMPIVKKLLTLMNGKIKVESVMEKGTTVTLTIPHKIADFSDYKLDAGQTVNMEELKGKRILLAEDNEFNCEVAADILTEAGFVVECAKDGIVCVAMLDLKPAGYYDMILMDIIMPHMDGIKAAGLIRSLGDKEKSQIPIIAMTANVTPEEKELSLKAGMNGFIGKPMEINSLCTMIQRVLGKK